MSTAAKQASAKVAGTASVMLTQLARDHGEKAMLSALTGILGTTLIGAELVAGIPFQDSLPAVTQGAIDGYKPAKAELMAAMREDLTKEQT